MSRKTLIAAGILAMCAGSAMADIEDHEGFVHQHRSASYEQNRTSGEEAPAPKPNKDGKRLPFRDCKWYEGATQHHGWPEAEIGNPNRPECPPEKPEK